MVAINIAELWPEQYSEMMAWRVWLGVVAGVLLWNALPGTAAAAPCMAANIRWAASTNTVYISGAGVVCTLTELDQLATKAVITQTNLPDKVWFVGSNIWLQNGATLRLYGSAAGGDVSELRLKSNNSLVANSTVFLRAYWGTIDINATQIKSWDEAAQAVDGEHAAYKRSFIQVKSFLESDGVTARQSRMDIAASDIGYLGFNGAEAYGLSWKVLGAQPGLFDTVGVLGTVTNSRIHHNYYGVYTWGADGMIWRNNEFDNNVKYGLDPHDNSDDLIIEDNSAHHNGTHGIICSRYCDHLTIRRNKAYNNGGNGLMLHRLTNESVVEDNELYDNADSGLAIFDSHNNVIRRNNSHDNKKGMRFSVGSSNNLIEDNDLIANSQYGIYFFKGSDLPTELGDGRPKLNRFIRNTIQDSGVYGLKLKEADDNLFSENEFIENGATLLLELATGNRFERNLIRDHTTAGITLSGATDHVIDGNTIVRNGTYGIYLKNGSQRAIITNNRIENHDTGVRIVSSNDVTLAGNTFVDNGQDIR